MATGRWFEVRALLEAAASTTTAQSQLNAVLRAVEGARSAPTLLDPLWTMPGHLAQSGPLTTSVAHLVDGARCSVTCSTFILQRTSELWSSLRQAARRPEIAARVCLDTRAADHGSSGRSPTTAEVAKHLRPATVLQTKEFDGGYVRTHAKFLAVRHRFLLVTSANFPWSTENNNIEFGVLIDNPNLAEAVERELLQAEHSLYERVVDRSSEGAR
ncbi:DISARM system phospholipase D-like protein DrmC [Streptomyces sp. ISL-99]|nr:DISARM system phospholipase D-like protein DrmC [Streptomyces sp. ISL-99]